MKRLHLRSIALLLAFGSMGACSVAPANFQEITALNPDSHEPKFPIAQGKHANIACNTCHGDFETFEQFNCIGCHEHNETETNNNHSGMADYKWESPSCYLCHPRGEADGAGNHDVIFPIGATSKHAGTSCTTCHTDTSNRKQVDCTSCHEHAAPAMAHAHTQVGGFAQESASCLRCHADSQVNKVDSHVPVRIDAQAKHFQKSCLDCHAAVRTDKPFGADFKTADCLGCHEHNKVDTDQDHVAITGYAWTTPKCLSCHPNGEGGVVDHARYFPIATGTTHAAAQCTDCHTNPNDRKVVDCTTCHEHAQATSAPQHSQVGGYRWNSALCLRCHAESQVNPVATHSRFPITRGTNHERESCIVCHPALRTDKPWAAKFDGFKCVNCHSTAHKQSQGDAGCYRCHPRGTEH